MRRYALSVRSSSTTPTAQPAQTHKPIIESSYIIQPQARASNPVNYIDGNDDYKINSEPDCTDFSDLPKAKLDTSRSQLVEMPTIPINSSKLADTKAELYSVWRSDRKKPEQKAKL